MMQISQVAFLKEIHDITSCYFQHIFVANILRCC